MDLYRKRSVYSATSLAVDLKCQEFSGWYEKFTWKFTTDEFSQPENCAKGDQIPSSYPGSRQTGSNIAILGHKWLVHPSAISFPNF
jgi:hypothetical protein